MRIRDFDLKAGTVSLDENKTDDPRTWALDAGTARALKAWVAYRDAKPEDLMFVDEHGNALTSDHRLAEQLRDHLITAGVDRRELHHDGKNRRKLRVHDLRATFTTLALANGRTETWVADRTGHRSSQMINRYRRQARSAAELGLGDLLALDQAIDELCQRQPTREEWRPQLALPEVNAQALGTDRLSEEGARGPSWPLHRPQKGGSTRNRTEDQRIKNPLL